MPESSETTLPYIDAQICVGSMKLAAGGNTYPMYSIDFGQTHPSFKEKVKSWGTISFDILPTESGFKFYVTSEKLISAFTPELSCYAQITKEDFEEFVSARAVLGGYWLLILLSEDEVTVLVSPNGSIENMFTKERQ